MKKFNVKMKKKQWELIKNVISDSLDMSRGKIYYIMYSICMRAYNKVINRRGELSDKWNNINASIICSCIREIENIVAEDSVKDTDSYKDNVNNLSNILDIISNGILSKSENDIISLEFDEKQISYLNNICDTYCRFICGQSFSIVQWLADKWAFCHGFTSEKYFEIKSRLELCVSVLHKICWNDSDNEYYGIGYDDDSDCLYDMHQVFRYELFKLNHKGEGKQEYTVDAFPAMRTSKKYDIIEVNFI